MSTRSENIRFNVYLNDKQAGSTTGHMYKQARVLRSEIAKLEIGSKKWIAKMNELKYVNTNMQRFRSELKGSTSMMSKLKATISKFGPALGLGVGLAAVSRLFNRAFGMISKFDSGLNELSAITGMVGSDLGFLKNKAIEMSTATDSAGNKINMSATKILNAFKLVGSAKPELLKNKEGLAEVTKQAIILSQATGGKMGLEESVKSLTTTMNQFNAPASEAGKFINVLAAGSKFGAGEIPFLAKAMEQAGTVAKSAGINIERTTGILELFAEKGLKAERSGVNFRNIIIELQRDTANYTDGVFDMDKALQGLAEIQDDTMKLTSLFGKENVTAAQIMAQGRDRINELTESLTNTRTAYEQSKTNSKGLSFEMSRLNNKYEAFILSLDSGKGILSSIVSGFVRLGGSILDAITPTQKMSEELIKQKANLNNLVLAATSANNTEETRKKLITEIQQKYPSFLKNLDTEKVTNEELKLKLADVNDEYDKKINLMLKEELYRKHSEKLIELKMSELNYIKLISFYEDKIAKGKLASEGDVYSSVNYNEQLEHFKTLLEVNRGKQGDLNQAIKDTIALLNEMNDEGDQMGPPTAEDPDPDSKEPHKNKYGQTFDEWKAAQYDFWERQKEVYAEYNEADIFKLEDEESEKDSAEYLTEIYKSSLDGRLTLLQANHAVGLISEAEYNAKLLALNKEKNKNEAKFDNMSKKQKLQAVSSSMDAISGLFKEGSIAARVLASGSAIVNTYSAATAALAPPPLGLGPIAGIPLAIRTVIAGLANVAKINAVQFAKGGIAKGPSHDQGGINMIDNRTGKKVGEMEGDEPYMIFSKKTYKNNRELINALLDSSLNHDGAPVSWMHPDSLSQPNLSDIINNHRSMFGAGGVTNVTNNYSQSEIIEKNEENTLIISRLDEMLEEFKKLKYLKTLIDIDGVIKIKESLNEIETIENESQI